MLEFIKFEINYRLSRPATYIYFAIMLLMAFLATSTDIVQAGGSGGRVMENAPNILATIQTLIMFFGVFIISAVMGVPVLRDFEHKTHSMIFTAPVSKFSYLGGKFIGSLIITLVIISGVLWGSMLGQIAPWPWHDFTDKLNPFSFSAYWNPFAIFILPNIFIFSAIFFAGGALGRNMVFVYAQGIILFMGYLVASQFLSELDNQNTAALMDPFGLGALSVTSQYWTVAEQNSLLFEWSGVILQNRIIWLIVGLVTLGFTYFRFSFSLAGNARKSKIGKKQKQEDEIPLIELPVVHQVFGLSAQILQMRSLGWFYFRWIIKQGPFVFITLAGVIFIFVIAFASGTSSYDVELYMTSSRAVDLIGIFNIFFIIIVVFYTGEIVWKERDVKINLIYDALPYPNYVVLAGKFLGMLLMSVTLLLVLMLCGVMLQLIKGYPVIEWNVYFAGLFTDTITVMILYILLGIFIQAVLNHKFLGFGLMFLFYISFIVMNQLGVEHNMFYYARAGLGTFSEMNQFGHYVTAFSWFNIYWFGFAGVLYAIAILLSVRGLDTKFSVRLKLGGLRLNKMALVSISLSLLVFLTSGGFIYYNTNILNEYQNSDDSKADRAAYENQLKQYEMLAQPRIIDTYVEVDLYPGQRDFKASGYYLVKNKTTESIPAIHIQKSVDGQLLTTVGFTGGSLSESFDDFSYEIYDLPEPMQPGDTIKIDFEVTFTTQGFKEGGSNNDVIFNGTFFNNSSYFPSLGYSSGFELSTDDDRKEQDLEPKERMMDRDNPVGIGQSLFGDDADKISFEIKVTTDSSQIAVAPGYLQSKVTEGARTMYHYKMDTPMVNFYSIISADYEVITDTWKPSVDSLPEVALEIYYHKGHEYNTDRMMNGMKEALIYYSENFSPFQFRQLRILEFPKYRSFAQSFANTVPFSEGLGFIQQIGIKDVDLPFYVTAHEVAHQWWGHQVTEAGVKGNAMLSETLSQYSALMVMKKNYSPEIIKEFLKHELNSYLVGRTFEQKKEMPLELVEGQGYIHYRKGSLVMYALQDYIGEDSVNAALKRFVQDWGFKDAPYPTSADLISYYRAVTPDSLQYVIDDMFTKITLFENKTTLAEYEMLEDSTYEVSLNLNIIKYQADSLGNESTVSLGDWIDVGVFATDADGEDKLIYLEKHQFNQQENELIIQVAEKPVKAGIDPINKLIDRNPKDNVKELDLKEVATL
ncbi:MAG: ABC-2 type transport system permease protein [Cyclobacteriaceae bacterium]|jgi:ABC-2 type transport system permease protein